MKQNNFIKFCKETYMAMRHTMPITMFVILAFLSHNNLVTVLAVIAIALATIGMFDVVQDEDKRIFK